MTSKTKKGSKPAKSANGANGKKPPTKRAGSKFPYPDTAKLKVLSAESPFRAGTTRDQIFKKLVKVHTVAEAKKVSSDKWHLVNAVKTKHIQVVQ